jgi:hypothetical protein
MANAPRRMDLRSTRLEIRAHNKALNEAAQKKYEASHRESNVSTAKTFKGQFNSRYNRLTAMMNPEGCSWCGDTH